MPSLEQVSASVSAQRSQIIVFELANHLVPQPAAGTQVRPPQGLRKREEQVSGPLRSQVAASESVQSWQTFSEEMNWSRWR